MISFNAYTADAQFEEPGCVYAAAQFNAEQLAKLPAADQAAYVPVTPTRYAQTRFRQMMRSWMRAKRQADADAAAKSVNDATSIPDV